METTQVEHVLVVPTNLFHDLGYFQGFNVEVDRYLNDLLALENISYRPRDEMETDPSFKQLIPYCLFRHTDEDGIVHLFQYTRGKGQGESRLHAKQSVGIGGHISTDDGLGTEAYTEGMQRELEEEVIINTTFEQRCVGLINDDESEVGRVHLGVVHIFDVQTQDIEPREADIIFAGFKPVEEILTELDNYETWSQFCVRALFG
ncbi:MAG: phosphoesterase [Pirellulaceae bacterium]